MLNYLIYEMKKLGVNLFNVRLIIDFINNTFTLLNFKL